MIPTTRPLIFHYEIKGVLNKNPYLLGEQYVNKRVWMVTQVIPPCKPKQIDYWTNFRNATRFLKQIGATWERVKDEIDQPSPTKRKWLAKH